MAVMGIEIGDLTKQGCLSDAGRPPYGEASPLFEREGYGIDERRRRKVDMEAAASFRWADCVFWAHERSILQNDGKGVGAGVRMSHIIDCEINIAMRIGARFTAGRYGAAV